MQPPTQTAITAAFELLDKSTDWHWLTRGKSFWRASEIADTLGVAAQSINKWCEQGKIFGAVDLETMGWRLPRTSLLVFFAQRSMGDPDPPKAH